ncbi:MAG TPA: hypothetical protein VI072_14160 [Polyangiaceae bacterium]
MRNVNELQRGGVGRSGSASRILSGLVGAAEVGTAYLEKLAELVGTHGSVKYRGRLQ